MRFYPVIHEVESVSALLQRHRLTIDDVYKMLEVGILNEGDRLELIEGELIDLPPMGPLHAGVGEYLEDTLRSALHQVAYVRIQKPVRLDQNNELETDISVIKHADDYYRSRHPLPTDVYLLIEIADSSLRKDRQIKLPLYARHNIPEVWIVNLEGKKLEVYRQPLPDKAEYSVITHYSDGKVAPEKYPEAQIAVLEIF
jgi:Uma2 family endonuclease